MVHSIALKSSLAVLVLASACASPAGENQSRDRQTDAAAMLGPASDSEAGAIDSPPLGDIPLPTARTLCEGLEVPWGMDLLPSGDLLVAERPGRVQWVNAQTGAKKLVLERSVLDRGEGGLLGLAVHPQFARTGWIYLYETTAKGNRIVRLRTEVRELEAGEAPADFVEDLRLEGIPHARFHDGGILRFGPDGLLYAGTGDARQPDRAADTASEAGKILRMTDGLEAAPGNPFSDYGRGLVYSLGHRNVQGLAWDADGTLWATEHGPSGELNGWCCHDELNRIQKGGHYGWPYVKGDDTHPGTAAPIAHSGMDTWAPGGCAVLGEDWGGFAGSVVLGGLRGEQLRRIERSWNPRNMRYEIKENAWFKGRFGRLRNVLVAADGTTLYVSTSNRDGRGRARSGDDRILVVKPKYGN